MKVNIVLDGITADFPYLIDKLRFEVIKTDEVDTWVVRKRDKVEIPKP